MTSVSHVTAMYATKRRRRNSKNVRTVCSKDSHSKSNPSKRHRERLNQELDTLASLLPFEQSVLSKLDKLSILRLSVSYLRTKSYFQAALSSCRQLPTASQQQQQSRAPHSAGAHYQQHQFTGVGGTGQQQQQLEPPTQIQQPQHYPAELRMQGDLIVQALNGFLLILTCDGEVFYTSHTVETYLGFHQSDICHQSVYELVHSEDREELMQQLKWNSMIPQTSLMTDIGSTATANQSNPLAAESERSGLGVATTEQQANKSASQMSLREILASADHRHLLERNFTVRFRCLLDNTSGFLRLDIRGRIKVLHGQQNQNNLANSTASNKKQQQALLDQGSFGQREPLLAFFGVCIPFGPPSLLEMPSKDSVFKSKHRLDLSIISMDSRGKQLLGLNDLTSIFKQATGSTSPSSGCGSPVPSKPQVIKPDSGSGASATVTTKAGAANTNATGASASASSNAKQQSLSAYDLVHQDDLSYMWSAHQELLKTGASGLIAYRMINQSEGKHQWLQTSAKLYYKNSKPDFILCTHRPLMEEEGRDLLGKRTMDFKVTYLDVGLSSINDRILACDKFSSLQALGGGSHKQAKSPSAALANSGLGRHHLASSSSPTLSGESSRSLASSSPSSMFNETSSIGDEQLATRQAKGAQATRRKFNYDLNPTNSHLNEQQQQQYSLSTDYEAVQQESGQQMAAFNGHYNTHYKRGQNGDVFYDMDSIQAATASSDETPSSLANRKTMPGKKKATGKLAAKQSAKKRAELAQSGSPAMGKSKMVAQEQHSTQQQQHVGQQQQQQQLHLYSHYNQHHLQSAEAVADSYPAIQAAAAYAASLGHPHSAAGVQPQASAYGTTANAHHHHGYHNQVASQSAALYGSASMVSPSAAAAYHSQHHQHHSQLAHQLDSASVAGYQQAGHYSTSAAFAGNQTSAVGQSAAVAAAAAASSFLPAEHLLHHYSQSAARSAALAGWPSTSVSSTSQSIISAGSNQPADHYHHHHHQHHHPSQTAYGSSTWGSSATAAAAAALVASASNSASSESAGKRDLDSYSPAHRDRYSSGSQTRNLTAPEQQQQYHHQQRHQLHLNQQQQQQQQQHHQQQQQHQHQQQQQPQNISPSMESGSPRTKSPASSLSAVAAAVVAQRYTNLGAHSQLNQSQQQQLAQKANAPASLASDGSAHRSPLSSGESSNGSAGLAAAQAVAAASAVAAGSQEPSSATMISPSTYYLSPEHSQQQQSHQQQQQHHLASQQQSYAAHQSQQLAAYHHHHHHQNPYAAAAQQYGDSTAHFNQHHYQHHHHHNQHHHQQVAFEHQHAAAYFQHTSGDLSAAAAASTVAAAAHTASASAVKLYGANGDLLVAPFDIEQYPPSYTYVPLSSLRSTNETLSAQSDREPKESRQLNWAPQQAANRYPSAQLADNSHGQARYNHQLGAQDGQSIEQVQTSQLEGPQYKLATHDNPAASESVSSWPLNTRPDGETGQFLASSSSSSPSPSSSSDEDGEAGSIPLSEGGQDRGSSGPSASEKLAGDDEDQRDPLARLISSTIGDNILDMAPKI